MDYQLDDTIAAIASPPGGGLRGIVRLSGAGVSDVVAAVFQPDAGGSATSGTRQNPKQQTQSTAPRVIAGRIMLGGTPLPGQLYLWPSARTYTGQPAAEFHTFGSPPLLEAVLQVVCVAGARLARPGEFTLRAFLAGRLDLTQAEAVLAVIEADDDAQLRHALDQAAGGIGHAVTPLRSGLLNLLADLEAGLDFVDEDIELISAADIARILQRANTEIERILAHVESRGRSDDRLRIVFRGPPNAGKSSLFNALVGRDAALVDAQPGATRDYLEHDVHWGDVCLRLIDTAGLWENVASGNSATAITATSLGNGDSIDAQAQLRTAATLAGADVILDCREAADSAARAIDNTGHDNNTHDNTDVVILQLATKADQLAGDQLPDSAVADGVNFFTSAHTGAGLETLRQHLCEIAADRARTDRRMLSASVRRCSAALREARRSLQNAAANLQPAPREELIAAEVRTALERLGVVAGAVYTDDLLDRIFSRFCIGK